MGLGWVYEIANVISAHLQKAVADIVTDFEKFSDTQLKKVEIVLSKSQGSF
jgi:hypothetical protein